jgi:hypothetical protein
MAPVATAASTELNALRDAVSCVVGFAELLAAEAGEPAAPVAAWTCALEANAHELLTGFARLERALAVQAATVAPVSAGGS